MILTLLEKKTLKEIIDKYYKTKLLTSGLLFADIGLDGTFTWLTQNDGEMLDRIYFLKHSAYKYAYFYGDAEPYVPTICSTETICDNDDTICGYKTNLFTIVKEEVVLMFKNKWNKLYELMTTQISALDSDYYTTTETPNLTNTTNASVDTYAFNSPTNVPQGKGVNTTTQTGSRTLSYRGLRGGNVPELIRKQIDTLQWNFYEQIMNDVDTIITLPLYDY